jgi:hypothetical protein
MALKNELIQSEAQNNYLFYCLFPVISIISVIHFSIICCCCNFSEKKCHEYEYNIGVKLQLNNIIKTFDFESKFNKQINCLPNSVKIINLGSSFNQPFVKLPNSLKYVTFGSNFLQRVDNLPESLIQIDILSDYNNTLDFLPSNLKYVVIKDDYKYLNQMKERHKNIKFLEFTDLNVKEYFDSLYNLEQ